jgi:hypothetical protein
VRRRVTVYCPKDLLAAIEAEVERSKREDPRSKRRSKTSVIVDAIREHLTDSPATAMAPLTDERGHRLSVR